MLLVDLSRPAGERTTELSVEAPKMGQRYDAICLTAEDFVRLARMPPQVLKEWAELWYLGFPPDARRKRPPAVIRCPGLSILDRNHTGPDSPAPDRLAGNRLAARHVFASNRQITALAPTDDTSALGAGELIRSGGAPPAESARTACRLQEHGRSTPSSRSF